MAVLDRFYCSYMGMTRKCFNHIYCRSTHGTSRKRHKTPTWQQQHNQSKATSSLFLRDDFETRKYIWYCITKQGPEPTKMGATINNESITREPLRGHRGEGVGGGGGVGMEFKYILHTKCIYLRRRIGHTNKYNVRLFEHTT